MTLSRSQSLADQNNLIMVVPRTATAAQFQLEEGGKLRQPHELRRRAAGLRNDWTPKIIAFPEMEEG